MYHVLMHEEPLENVVEPTDVRNLFVAPASLDLAGAEIELVPAFSREQRLKRAIEAVLDDYDYVLIDCPPSLGLLTVNGLAAAREVMVPIQCEYYALEGLGQLLRNVDLVKRNLNPTLDVSTILCVMYDARTEPVRPGGRARSGSTSVTRCCVSVIPRSVRLSEAPSFGQPITTFDPEFAGSDRVSRCREGGPRCHALADLGKGLSSIIPGAELDKEAAGGADAAALLADVAVAVDRPNPHQPRVHFDEESLLELSASIAEMGVLQPILVRPARRWWLRTDRRRAAVAGRAACRPGDDPGDRPHHRRPQLHRAGTRREPPSPGSHAARGSGCVPAADRGLPAHARAAVGVGSARAARRSRTRSACSAFRLPCSTCSPTVSSPPVTPGRCSAPRTVRCRSGWPDEAVDQRVVGARHRTGGS